MLLLLRFFNVFCRVSYVFSNYGPRLSKSDTDAGPTRLKRNESGDEWQAGDRPDKAVSRTGDGTS